MVFEKLASAIRNNVVSGLQGYHSNTSFTLELIEDDIADLRASLLFQMAQQGILPIKDLLLEINCIEIDCKDIEKCSKCSCSLIEGTPTMHFEIPQLFMGLGGPYVSYLGSPDRQNPFTIYTSPKQWKLNKYRRRSKLSKPYVYIDTTPNENGMYDCFVYNAPLMKTISITALFKDPRQLELYGCCDTNKLNDDNLNPINIQIKQTLSDQYIKYYRQLATAQLPNDQLPKV